MFRNNGSEAFQYGFARQIKMEVRKQWKEFVKGYPNIEI